MDVPKDAWMTAIVDASSDAIVSFTLDGCILSWNTGATVMFGYSADEMIGQPLLLLVPSGYADEHQHILQQLKRGGTINQRESVRRRKNGKQFPVMMTISPVRDQANTVIGAVAIVQDITERKRAEERQVFLLKLGDALRSLADPLAVQETAARLLGEQLRADRVMYVEVVAAEGVRDYVVERNFLASAATVPVIGRFSADQFGPSLVEESLAGRTMVVNDIERDPRLAPHEREAFLALGIKAYIITPLIKEGTWVAAVTAHQLTTRAWTADEIALVEEVAERTWAAVERARAEKAVLESTNRLRTLIENLPGAAVFVVDPQLRYLVAEGSALATAGLRSDDLAGRTIHAALPPELAAQYEPKYRSALAGEPFEYEHDAHQRSFISRGVPLRSTDDDGVDAVLVVSYDITERKQAEAERERLLRAEHAARAEAEAALQTRDQFLSIASHELRTPLTSLLGYASMLRSDVATEPSMMHQMTEHIIRQAQRLDALVGQLLDLSRLQRGQFMISPQPIDIAAVVAEVVDAARIVLVSADQSITYTHPDDPVMLMGDAERLEQVIQNLVNNAIKYSPWGGPVRVAVRSTATEAIVEVEDQGIGIPASAHARLFEPFYRAANVGMQISGFGLGLYIVQEIVARHGGRIEVESTEGKGSTFRVVLPLLGSGKDGNMS